MDHNHGGSQGPAHFVAAACRRIGLPVAFFRMLNDQRSFNRATPFARWIEDFELYRNEMVFERSSPSCETALLVSVAVLDLRMKLHRIVDSELKALCDAMSGNEAPAETSHEPKAPQGRRRRTLPKLVK